MQTIGFIGLGHMGGNMAARYLAAGYTVYGEERNREEARWLTEQGLRWAGTPQAVAAAADIVMTSLPNDEVVEAVATGHDGILAGLEQGKVWADLSTLSPGASRTLAARVREQGKGAQMLDAPVSRSVPQVKTGSLAIMVGGDAEAFRRVEPALRVLGTPVHVGANGQGLVLKLAINISLAVQMLAFSEGLLLADRDGIDRYLAATAMSQSAIGSPMLKARVPLVLGDSDETWFDVSLMHKDIRLALAAAREHRVPVPSAEVAGKVLTRAADLGFAHRDIAAIFEVLATDTGVPSPNHFTVPCASRPSCWSMRHRPVTACGPARARSLRLACHGSLGGG
jgi:3-hydroxyisobutyrate dehydrogenase-like beta-hydroxyacid dehydrogenase